MSNSGKSKSEVNHFGIRRRKASKDMAPRSLRLKGKTFISECTDAELKKAGVK